jgi:hypothetical protein
MQLSQSRVAEDDVDDGNASAVSGGTNMSSISRRAVRVGGRSISVEAAAVYGARGPRLAAGGCPGEWRVVMDTAANILGQRYCGVAGMTLRAWHVTAARRHSKCSRAAPWTRRWCLFGLSLNCTRVWPWLI